MSRTLGFILFWGCVFFVTCGYHTSSGVYGLGTCGKPINVSWGSK